MNLQAWSRHGWNGIKLRESTANGYYPDNLLPPAGNAERNVWLQFHMI
jgi:hypothetical protein